MFLPLKDENPTKTFPYKTILLIACSTFVFFIELAMGQYRGYIVAKFGMIPFEITHGVDLNPEVALGPYITLLTSLFLHGSFLHLIGNMWFLWIFGNNIEDVVGHYKFIAFYILGGFAASFLQIAVSTSSTVPVIGASGAVSAVLGAYILKFPKARVKTLMFLFIFVTDMVFYAASVFRAKVREQCGVVRSYRGVHIRPSGDKSFSKKGKKPEVQDLLMRISNIIPVTSLGFLSILSVVFISGCSFHNSSISGKVIITAGGMQMLNAKDISLNPDTISSGWVF